MEVVRRGLAHMWRRLINRENLLAVALFIALVLLVIATSDSASQWIYQGF